MHHWPLARRHNGKYGTFEVSDEQTEAEYMRTYVHLQLA